MAEHPFPLLDPDAARAAAAAAGIPEIIATVNLLRTTLHQPNVAQVIAAIIDKITLGGSLPVRLKELAILRVGWRLDATYEWSSHYPIAVRAGITDTEVLAVREGPTAAGLDATARAVLALVDEVLDDVAVTTATLEDTRAALGDDGALMELLVLPGLYRTLATVLKTLSVPLDKGRTAWQPDGVGPD